VKRNSGKGKGYSGGLEDPARERESQKKQKNQKLRKEGQVFSKEGKREAL